MTAALSKLEFGQGSQVNVPIGVLLWLMIYPMMLKVDFSAIGGIARRPKGLMVTLFVNWLVKPFGMALLAWVFMQHVFAAWIDPETAQGLHGRADHPGGGALHGDGVRVVVSDGWRPGLHAGAGGGERPDHAGGVRADCDVPVRGGARGGAGQGADYVGGGVHRDSADGGVADADGAAASRTGRSGSRRSSCRSFIR